MADSGWHRRRNDTPAAQERKRQYNTREYKTAKAAARRQVQTGAAHCWRCGAWIPPGSDWHLGHDDHDRTIINGPEHAACNLKTAASRGAKTANARRSGTHTAPRRTRAW